MKAIFLSSADNARAHLVADDAATTLCRKAFPAKRRRFDVDEHGEVQIGTYQRRYVCQACKNATADAKAKRASTRLTAQQVRDLHLRAREAGRNAADAARPTPMVVGTPVDMMASLTGSNDGGFRDDRPVHVIPDGVCGFAYVTVKGGTSFARRMKLRAHHGGGCYLRDFGYNGQSYERNVAAASAYAEVLRNAGIDAYMESRLD